MRILSIARRNCFGNHLFFLQRPLLPAKNAASAPSSAAAAAPPSPSFGSSASSQSLAGRLSALSDEGTAEDGLSLSTLEWNRVRLGLWPTDTTATPASLRQA